MLLVWRVGCSYHLSGFSTFVNKNRRKVNVFHDKQIHLTNENCKPLFTRDTKNTSKEFLSFRYELVSHT